MNIHSYQQKSFCLVKENKSNSHSTPLVLQNLQLHLSSISQLSCLKPLFLQPQIPPNATNHLLTPYLQYHYLKSKGVDFFYLNQSLLTSANSTKKKLQEVTDGNKNLISEINWIAQEKIDSINEKEEMEQDLEQCHKTERNLKRRNVDLITDKNKHQRIKELKDAWSKMNKEIDFKMRKYKEMQIRNRQYVNDNKIIIEKIKQKQIIYDQIIGDINEVKIALTKHKKLMSVQTKGKQDLLNVTDTKKRNKSSGLFKKLFK